MYKLKKHCSLSSAAQRFIRHTLKWIVYGGFILHLLIFFPYRGLGEPLDRTITLFKENAKAIRHAARVFEISPRLLVSAVYADRRMHYNLLDAALDEKIAKAGRNNSIGLAQIRVSTAQWVSKTINDSSSLYSLDNEYTLPGFTSRSDLINKLMNTEFNMFYGAAYAAMILHRWKYAGIDITDNVPVFATLYNLGPYRRNGSERKPHTHPISTEFGYVAKAFYESDLLLEEFPRNQ